MTEQPIGNVPVEFSHPVRTLPQSAEYGAFTTRALTGTEAAFIVLPYDEHRSEAMILVTNGSVFLGTEAQCKAATPLGGLVPVNVPVFWRNKQSLWLVGNGSAASVTILNQRWDDKAKPPPAGD